VIRRVAGEIAEVLEESAVLRSPSGLCYEVLVGGYALPELRALMAAREPVELHTYHYLEGNVASGQLIPRLAGFFSHEEREFFLRLIKVPGFSPRSGVRALGLPPREVARAISLGNTALLTKLPGIGKKKAEQLVSQLRGEIADLALAPEAAADRPEASPCRSEAMAVLVGQLGYRTPEAEDLVERALAALGAGATTETVLKEVFRLSR
jgi:Holliday junction DNA helicase RuvA